MQPPIPLRWLVFGIFILSSALNYLDRLTMAAVAPFLQTEFHLSNEEYGLILTAFSITYATCAPFAGLFIDRVGLNLGISLAVAFWSLAGIATGLMAGLPGLVLCYGVLGLAQAGGIPATGKAIATYLRPQERALGNAFSQMGLSLGAMLAPPIAIGLAARRGWRSAFVVTGLVSLLWVPLWNSVARAGSSRPAATPGAGAAKVFADRRLWGFVIANILSMTVYTLWTNWTTLFLVQAHRLTPQETAWLAWIPPLFANLGGLLGGWLSLKWINDGVPAVAARMRACLLSALALLVTAAVPWMPGAGWATGAICLSFFWSAAMSVNLYTLPLDIYGAAHAAFAVSMLTAAYGAMQAAFSPAIGALIDSWGFQPVCALVAVLPLAGYVALEKSGVRSQESE